ncbi:McrB family protein [Pectobacterium versatile]|uniref:McrB family protein n=1 Tax=Pectobacterium versatile TaxID=2488639 RepID=UPI001F416835|nr:AAA family ATPase [Pectobacterium versatile]
MNTDYLKVKVREWLEGLIDVKLDYISGRNSISIKNIDWDGERKIEVERDGKLSTVSIERIFYVIDTLVKGDALHVDTLFKAGSNDRSVIETILAHFPPIGFLKSKTVRNQSNYKMIQWMSQDIHPLGVVCDVSDEKYAAYIINKHKVETTLSLPKPFLLLAGISGTGKSRFVREQAEATGSRQETYCLVSVRPDWHEPSDLLGYTTRLNNNAEYVITDVLQFIVKAWKTIAETGVQIAGNKTSGNRNDLQAIPPYWLCLDEMNLAPVEQYFADYLSILETREWEWEDDEFTYQCDPLLKASVIQSLSDDKRNELCERLELDPTSALWLEFSKHGIGIPFNLLVAGTVNMDETTHGFSRKVIDRALSFDFGDFFPNDFNEYFSPTVASKKLTYPIYSSAVKNKERLPVIDADGKASIQFLHALNTVLDNTPFKLAYRALNELLLSVISHQPEDEMQLQAVWDDFLMCKLLPRIEGDSDKLAQHDIDESLLIKLSGILKENLSAIWNQPNARQDFYREKHQDGETIMIACRSRAKIDWMQNKLAQSGFTSFWP